MEPMDAMSLPANRHCPIARTLAVLGQKWNLLLLREAFLGRTRFAEFQRIGIPNATLGQRLNDLVCAGLLERVTYQEEGERSREEYVLTDAGRDVLPILAALSEWGTGTARSRRGGASCTRSTGSVPCTSNSVTRTASRSIRTPSRSCGARRTTPPSPLPAGRPTVTSARTQSVRNSSCPSASPSATTSS